MGDCNILIVNGIEYTRQELADRVRKGEISLPSIVSNDSGVKTVMKSVILMGTPKVQTEWNKFIKNKITFDQFLYNSQFPSEQKPLIQEVYNENKTESLDQLTLDLASKYSYVVEVNTAKSKDIFYDGGSPDFNMAGHWYRVDLNQYTDSEGDTQEKVVYSKDGVEISEKEFEDAKKNAPQTNAQYYSNLTVPGGTNYTENEISTPGITPSIKGHAQFSTDSGIGWFRSDEQVIGGGVYAQEEDDYGPSILQTYGGTSTKTRRILEVQSDLFQKGRDKEQLAFSKLKSYQKENFVYKGERYEVALEESTNQARLYHVYNDGIHVSDSTIALTKSQIEELGLMTKVLEIKNRLLEKAEQNRNESAKDKSNDFLQLLNKDGNWIPFFIKTIVQDSAKKGYEKVLFPTGDTASKVEGHQTLEQFKQQKIEAIDIRTDKIKVLQDDNEHLVRQNKISEIITDKGKERNLQSIQRNNTDIDGYQREIIQFQEELKRVESEGFAALKPIYDFYENRVKNTLNKIYGKDNVLRIKDEYDNFWYQVNVDQGRDKAVFAHEIDFEPQDFRNMPFKISGHKIASGNKTITVRPQSYRMGTYKANNGKLYNVIPEGKGYLGDYLVSNNMTRQDFIKNFIGDEEERLNHIKEFLIDNRELYIYRIEKVMSADDIIPEISDPRFAKVYEHRLVLIRHIRKQIRDEQDPGKVEELRARLSVLKDQAKMLESDDSRTFAALLDMMKSDLATVKKILASKTDRRSLDFAKSLISNYVELLTKDFGDVLDNLNGTVKEDILNFLADVTRVATDINKQFLAIINAEVIRLTGKDQLNVDGTIVDADDTNIAASWLYDVRNNKNPVSQALSKTIRDAQVTIGLRLGEFRAVNTRLVKNVKRYGYDFMIQTDGKGRRTGLFVSKESAEYKEAKKKASEKVDDNLVFYAQNHTFIINDAAWVQREAFLMDYYRDNNNIVLTDTDIDNGTTLSDKVERFASMMTLKKNPYSMKSIFDKVAKNPKSMNKSDKEFFLEFIEHGGFYGEKMGDKYVRPLEYTTHDKWNDPKYITIQGLPDNDPRKMFYNHWTEHISKGRRMRRDEDRYIPWNYIPEKYKPLGILAKTNQFMHDHLGQRISNNKGSIDPETGEIEKRIPTYMLNDTISPENKSYDLGDVLEDFVKETLNYEEKNAVAEQANMLLSMIRQQPVWDTNPDGSIKKIDGKKQHKDGLSNNYFQAAHKLASSLYGETQDQELVTNIKLYNSDTKAEMKQLRLDIDALGLSTSERTIATQHTANKVPYTGNNKKIANYVDMATKYQRLRDSGRNLTGSKVVNGLMFATSLKFLGLNLFAGFGELLQGYTGLFTEASAKSYFTDKEAGRAMGTVMSALTPWDNPMKSKVAGVASIFDTVGDIFHESEARVKSKLEGWSFAQYKLANYGTNTSFTIAMLMHDKVKDTSGVEHSVWDSIDIKDGKISWNKKIDVDLYVDGKPSQFLLDLIHKSDTVLSLNRERKTFMDPIKVDAKMAGRIIGQFKKNWMIGMFYNRFGGKKDANLTGGKEFEGFYMTFWKSILAPAKVIDPVTGEERVDTSLSALMRMPLNFLKYMFKFSTLGRITGNGVKDGEYDPMIEANLRKFMREISFALTLWGVMIVLSSMNGGDDRDPFRTYVINQISRLQRDVTTFLGFESLASFIKNPAPIASSLTDMTAIFDATMKSTVLGDPFNSDGELRVWKATERNIPFLNQVHNMKSKFDQAILYGRF